SARPKPGWVGAITWARLASASSTGALPAIPVAGCRNRSGRPCPRSISSTRTPLITIASVIVDFFTGCSMHASSGDGLADMVENAPRLCSGDRRAIACPTDRLSFSSGVRPARPWPRESRMASIDEFNDHCWKDVVPQADLELYAGWRRETFVGP